MILAAGIVGETIAAAEYGWTLNANHEDTQAAEDIADAKRWTQQAGQVEAFARLWQEAQSEAARLFQRTDIREAWQRITELLLVQQQMEWKEMSDQMRTLLTRLRGRDQLI